jgi:cytochrome P450
MYLSEAPASPAGPEGSHATIIEPPAIGLPGWLQTLRFSQRQIQFVFAARAAHGDVFRLRAGIRGGAIVTCHPDHVRSLFTAEPEQVPTLTAESPLRPIVGPSSVLTTNGPAHLRQRKLLLPAFHGEAIDRYSEMIERATEAEIERWPTGQPFPLAPRMQAITLQVIMAGVFGIDGRPPAGSAEERLVRAIKQLTAASTSPMAKIAELANHGRPEPVGLMRRGVEMLDHAVYPAIAARREAGDLAERTDILSVLLQTETESGDQLSDQELRDELLTLLLAGFETTANSLAWTWERLVRTPDAYERLREAVRTGEDAHTTVEATILEGMRSRPVIPIIGRRVGAPWRLGEYVVPAGSAISASILLVHHREDLYPEPFAFVPERWIGRKPSGTRRCLGATLAMAEQRIVLSVMARRLDLVAEEPEAEHAQHRNVTMIPGRGATVIVRGRS